MDWILPNSATPGPIPGDFYMDEVQAKVARLSQGITVVLSGVAGTPNAITANADPLFIAGLYNGMTFVLPVGATANTGAVTLALNGLPAANVVDLNGVALESGRLMANSKQTLVYVAGSFVLTTDSRTNTNILDYRVFTASGTWSKPVGTPGNAWVNIEVWSGGGGGGTGTYGGGGGGGGYYRRLMRASQLASSVSVVVGAGGSGNTDGTASSFGTHLTVSPGLAGTPSSNAGTGLGQPAGNGGGGGGVRGGNDFSGANGSAGRSTASGGAITAAADGTDSHFGGASGGSGGLKSTSAGATSPATIAGNSYFGGGGGAGRANALFGTAGTSVVGGNGGAVNANGSAPAGGGGANGNGARGEVRVWVHA